MTVNDSATFADLTGNSWSITHITVSNEQKTYMAENGIEVQMSMPDSLQQNGCAASKPSLMELRPCSIKWAYQMVSGYIL